MTQDEMKLAGMTFMVNMANLLAPMLTEERNAVVFTIGALTETLVQQGPGARLALSADGSRLICLYDDPAQVPIIVDLPPVAQNQSWDFAVVQ